MDTDNTQGDAEPSLASAGSVGEVLAKGIADIIRIAAEPDWIPVTERLPEEMVSVLVWMPDLPHAEHGIDIGSYMNFEWGVSWMVSDGRSAFPTHWMPLPAPPSDGK